MKSKNRSRAVADSRIQRAASRIAPFAGAFLSTLLSLPTVAVTIPTVPLQSGSNYPPPNIMFILDDSGSMAFNYMPDDVPNVTPDRIENLAYPRNTLSYDPAVTYLAWKQANTNNSWTRITGGTAYNAAYSSFNFAGPGYNTIDLGDSNSCHDEDYNGQSPSVCGGVQTFYVPKDLTLPLTDTSMASTSSYWRYQITAGGASIVRSEFGPVVTTTTTSGPIGFPKNNQSASTDASGNSGRNMEITHTFTVPANIDQMIVTSSGGTHGTNGSANNSNGNGADLYVDEGSTVATNDYTCRSLGGSNNESCTINNPNSGGWIVGLNRDSSFVGVTISIEFRVVTDNRCPPSSGDPSWINCTGDLPTSRTLNQEKINYATWFSFYRSRMKLAKAGASEAFSQIGSNLRVGYDSIWNRDVGLTDTDIAAGAAPVYKIPVGTDKGLFRNQSSPLSSNRTDWYSRLFSAQARSGTPLKGALQRSGTYYSDTTATGPWGPEVDPAQLSCRQSFAILTTDGYWNDNTGYTAIGDADSDAATSASPLIQNIPAGKSFRYSPETPFADNPNESARADTLADVAMYYWKRDLVPSLKNDVPESSADEAWWQHMSTFSISIGLQGTLDPTNLRGISDGVINWPNPLDTENNERIDDLWHAAVNGHGSFVSAKSPAAFAQALSDSLSLIAARRGSASNVATNSTSFQADTRVYQARYWSGRWTGELAAYVATSAGVQKEPTWQASQGIPAVGSRTVLTFNGSVGATFPTAAQIIALDQSTRPLSPVSGATNAAYLKGDSSLEERVPGVGHNLRSREITIRSASDDIVRPTVLGDIVNSTPIYVQELQTLYVGANDGMMHAFNSVTGAERFAYVPGLVNLANMATLSDPDYVHGYLVDGPIAVSTTTQTPGHNYLVGTLGRGGKGLYALDVYSSDKYVTDGISPSDVLWEYGATDLDMGYVLGEPLMVTMNDGTKAVIVSNGINSSNGRAVLYIINVATGVVIKKIDTGVGGGNALFAPRGWDNNSDGKVDFVYAGDLKGHVWKFDLQSTTPGLTATTGWKVALSGMPLYTAVDASNNPQPITAGIALGLEPNTSRRWVFIGTGQFLETTDVATKTVQSMYGFIDEDTPISGRTSGGDGVLQKRQIVVAGQTYYDTDGDGDLDGLNNTTGNPNQSDASLRDVRGFEANAPLGTKKGWYIDMVKPPTPTAEGERIVSNPRLVGTVLITASLIPPVDNTCDAGGKGFINALDAFTGTSLTVAFFNANGTKIGGVQNFGDDKLSVGGGNFVAIGSIDLGLGMPTLPTLIDKLLVAGGSAGTIGNVAVNPQGSGSRRVSWREILKD